MTIIYAIIMFCVLIFIHELGHFIAAKSCGVKVNKFAIGMGPAIVKKQKGETEYSLRAFPIGGFCAMEGEDEDSSDEKAFNNKPAWKKAIIVCAGSAMNVILALVLMTIVVYSLGTATTTVGKLLPGTPAVKAGIQQGDKIVKVGDTDIKEWEDVSDALAAQKSDRIDIVVDRDGKKVSLTTGTTVKDGRRIMGISPTMKKSAAAAIANGPKATWQLTKSMYKVLKQLVTGQVSAKEMSGPVGIVYMVGKTSQQGLVYLLYLVALISLNLAVINMLPLPALDGGRLAFIIIRKITGRAITDKIEGRVHLAGMMLLFALMIYVTWNDIVKFIVPIFH